MKGTVLIAGGSGLIGRELQSHLRNEGFSVKVLTRGKSSPENDYFHWDIQKNLIDAEALIGVTHLINLSGTSVAGKRWSEERKKDIINSRVNSAKCLFHHFKNSTSLKGFISASGINAYPFDDHQLFVEEDEYGEHFLAKVVQAWEESARLFEHIVPVALLRIGVVFSPKGGALHQMAAPVKFFAGAPLGSGTQQVPWTDSEDLCRLFTYAIEQSLSGPFNAINGNLSNTEITKLIGKSLKRPVWPIKVPSFLMKMLLGEQSTIVLDGLMASNEKLKSSGFIFNYEAESSVKRSLNP